MEKFVSNIIFKKLWELFCMHSVEWFLILLFNIRFKSKFNLTFKFNIEFNFKNFFNMPVV